MKIAQERAAQKVIFGLYSYLGFEYFAEVEKEEILVWEGEVGSCVCSGHSKSDSEEIGGTNIF